MIQDTYREATRKAILEPVIKDIYEMKLVYRDGKFVRGPFATLDVNSLWVWTAQEESRRCSTWNDIYYGKYGFVSRNCFSCWKVFCKLDSIIDLLKVRKLQVMMSEHSEGKIVGKCGPELRSYAKYGGRYLGVWYPPITKTNTLKEARELAEEVKKALEEIEVLEKVYVVRGCTEMEAQAGPSYTWTYPEEMHEFEDKLDNLFDIVESAVICPEHNDYKIKKWMDHAFMIGDPAVKFLVRKYPDEYGVRARVNYAEESPEIASKNVKRGRLYDPANREGSSREEHERIFIL